MRKQNLPLHQLMNSEAIKEVAAQLRYIDVAGLFAGIGEGHVSAQSVIEKITAIVDREETGADVAAALITSHPVKPRKRESDSGVVVEGADDVLVKLAKCCTPVPGDDIQGFVTTAQGVSVHRTDCPNFVALAHQQDRVLAVSWAPTSKSVFLVKLQVEALARSGLLSDVTRVLSEHHVNILSASVNTSSSRLAISRFVFEMANTTHLDHVLNAVRRIDGVYDTYRVNSG